MRPSGGSTISDVRRPVCLRLRNTELYAPATSSSVPRTERVSLPGIAERILSSSAISASVKNSRPAYFAGRFIGPAWPKKLYESVSGLGKPSGVSAPASPGASNHAGKESRHSEEEEEPFVQATVAYSAAIEDGPDDGGEEGEDEEAEREGVVDGFVAAAAAGED